MILNNSIMSNPRLFNFTVDKEARKIYVERSFEAPLDRVWEAFTNSKVTDQWWAPKPWRAETKLQDFREGGRWVYAMVSPEGEKQWCLFEYKSIQPKNSFSGIDAFCDENEIINKKMPRLHWNNSFNDRGGHTVADIE